MSVHNQHLASKRLVCCPREVPHGSGIWGSSNVEMGSAFNINSTTIPTHSHVVSQNGGTSKNSITIQMANKGYIFTFKRSYVILVFFVACIPGPAYRQLQHAETRFATHISHRSNYGPSKPIHCWPRRFHVVRKHLSSHCLQLVLTRQVQGQVLLCQLAMQYETRHFGQQVDSREFQHETIKSLRLVEHPPSPNSTLRLHSELKVQYLVPNACFKKSEIKRRKVMKHAR